MTQSEFENLLQKLLVLVRSSDQGDVDKELRKVTAAITGPDPNLEQLREKQLETDRAFKPVELRTETDAEAHKLGRKKKYCSAFLDHNFNVEFLKYQRNICVPQQKNLLLVSKK